MAELLFFIAGPLAVIAALGVVLLRNPFYAVLSLVTHLLALATLFLLLSAQFIAAVQVLVYVGAVMVLYVFVNAYVGSSDDPRGGKGPALGFRAIAFAMAGALVVLLGIVTLGSGLKAMGGDAPKLEKGFGSPERIGELLLTDYLLAFEASSFLLLVAAVGAVVLARRRAGSLPGEDRMITALDLLAPTGTGSMREGVGAMNPVPGAFQAEITPSTGASAPPSEDEKGSDA